MGDKIGLIEKVKFMRHVLFIAFFLCCKGLIAQKRDAATAKKLISNYLDAVGNYGNAGQVLIAEGNNVFTRKNYGYAVIQKKQAVTDETIFEIASASKAFTAIAILKLNIQGKLNITDTLGKFFNEAPSGISGITIHQLLTHSSGIPGGDLIEDFQPITRQDLIKMIFKLPLRAKPGTRFIYSNAGFNLLAAVIEKVSGKEYGEFLEEVIFNPLGMTHSSVNGSKKLIEKKTAHAYNGIADKNGPEQQVFNARTWGGGSVCSTVSDLWLLKEALDGDTFLSRVEKEKMFSVQFKISEDNNYGYGCFVYWMDGKKIVDIIGETERGFNATFRNFVDDNRTLISLSNSSQPNERHNRWFLDAHLKNLWLETKHFVLPPGLNKSGSFSLKTLTGSYFFNSSSLVISEWGNNLAVEAKGQEAVEFLYNYNKEQVNITEEIKRKIGSLTEAYLTGTNNGFKAILSEGNIPDFAAERDNLILKYGKLKSYTISGIIPDRDPNFWVASIELQFENGKIPFFSMWNAEDPRNIRLDFTAPGLQSTIVKVFSPLNKREFISYNFFTDKVVSAFRILKGPEKQLEGSNKIVFTKK